MTTRRKPTSRAHYKYIHVYAVLSTYEIIRGQVLYACRVTIDEGNTDVCKILALTRSLLDRSRPWGPRGRLGISAYEYFMIRGLSLLYVFIVRFARQTTPIRTTFLRWTTRKSTRVSKSFLGKLLCSSIKNFILYSFISMQILIIFLWYLKWWIHYI